MREKNICIYLENVNNLRNSFFTYIMARRADAQLSIIILLTIIF